MGSAVSLAIVYISINGRDQLQNPNRYDKNEKGNRVVPTSALDTTVSIHQSHI